MYQPFYNNIAKAWHKATGSTGGPLKRHVLNDLLLNLIDGIDGRAILEIGAGNGYFARLMVKRFSGQIPSRLVLADISEALLEIAQSSLRIPDAEYRRLDARAPFPFEAETFDLILATMLLNELRAPAPEKALGECARVLRAGGRLIVTIPHPKFVHRLKKDGKLSQLGSGLWTMPGKGSLRLPIVLHTENDYKKALTKAGFVFESEPVFASRMVLNEKSGLRKAPGIPLALVFSCSK